MKKEEKNLKKIQKQNNILFLARVSRAFKVLFYLPIPVTFSFQSCKLMSLLPTFIKYWQYIINTYVLQVHTYY